MRARALQHLARRELSRVELQRKLQAFAADEYELQALLDELVEQGYLSDVRAFEQYVHYKQQRYGVARMGHELRQKGIAEQVITESLEQLKHQELEVARQVWQKKFGSSPTPPSDKEKAKQIRFLQSRGFPLDVIFKLLKVDAA